MYPLFIIAAIGQTPTFMAFDLRVAHPVLAPGQVQSIEVWASFTPKGTVIYPGATVLLFGDAKLDFQNVSGFQSGAITGFIHGNLAASVPGIMEPDGDLVGMFAVEVETGPTNQENPIRLMTYEWTPDPLLGSRTVEIGTRIQSDYFHHIWLVQPGMFPKHVFWPTDEVFHDSVNWKVIPAPGIAGVLAFAGLIMAARQRRRS